jgi:23S rRNA (adenine2503-C2)-methyltransferase
MATSWKAFCASTKAGLVRNLTPGEMLGEVIAANAAHGAGRQVTNLVLMGSGEPLDNYENVLKFLRMASAPEGLGISPRNISVSTCGLPEGMRRLAKEALPLTLCLSLHSPDDTMRAKLIPAAKAYSVRQVMDALRDYVQETGRRAIVEYALISGINDRPEDAAKLAAVLHGLQCHVNVIPLNDVLESGLKGSPEAVVKRFLADLDRLGVSATKRRTLGEDIEGACGQLRRRHLEE